MPPKRSSDEAKSSTSPKKVRFPASNISTRSSDRLVQPSPATPATAASTSSRLPRPTPRVQDVTTPIATPSKNAQASQNSAQSKAVTKYQGTQGLQTRSVSRPQAMNQGALNSVIRSVPVPLQLRDGSIVALGSTYRSMSELVTDIASMDPNDGSEAIDNLADNLRGVGEHLGEFAHSFLDAWGDAKKRKIKLPTATNALRTIKDISSATRSAHSRYTNLLPRFQSIVGDDWYNFYIAPYCLTPAWADAFNQALNACKDQNEIFEMFGRTHFAWVWRLLNPGRGRNATLLCVPWDIKNSNTANQRTRSDPDYECPVPHTGKPPTPSDVRAVNTKLRNMKGTGNIVQTLVQDTLGLLHVQTLPDQKLNFPSWVNSRPAPWANSRFEKPALPKPKTTPKVPVKQTPLGKSKLNPDHPSKQQQSNPPSTPQNTDGRSLSRPINTDTLPPDGQISYNSSFSATTHSLAFKNQLPKGLVNWQTSVENLTQSLQQGIQSKTPPNKRTTRNASQKKVSIYDIDINSLSKQLLGDNATDIEKEVLNYARNLLEVCQQGLRPTRTFPTLSDTVVRNAGAVGITKAIEHISNVVITTRQQMSTTFPIDNDTQKLYLALFALVGGISLNVVGRCSPWIQSLFGGIAALNATAWATQDLTTHYTIGRDMRGSITMNAARFRAEEWITGPQEMAGWLGSEMLNTLLRYYLQGSTVADPDDIRQRDRPHTVVDSELVADFHRGIPTTTPGFDNRADIVYIPVHLNGNHWALAIYDRVRRQIDFMNSIPDPSIHQLFQTMVQNWLAAAGEPIYGMILVHHTDTQAQENGADCGFWVVANAVHFRTSGNVAPRMLTSELRSQLGGELMHAFTTARRQALGQGLPQPNPYMSPPPRTTPLPSSKIPATPTKTTQLTPEAAMRAPFSTGRSKKWAELDAMITPYEDPASEIPDINELLSLSQISRQHSPATTTRGNRENVAPRNLQQRIQNSVRQGTIDDPFTELPNSGNIHGGPASGYVETRRSERQQQQKKKK